MWSPHRPPECRPPHRIPYRKVRLSRPRELKYPARNACSAGGVRSIAMVDQPDGTGAAGSRAQTPAASPGGAAPAAAAATPAGHAPAFEYENGVMDENFNLRPRTGFNGTIPEDQRKVSQDVYEARNVLKLLQDDQAITDALFKEFIARDTQAGFAGCVANNVDTTLAAEALVQIRADIVRRVGTPLGSRYLGRMTLYAAARCVVGRAQT